MRNKKILFIPADVIKNEVSRSFYFARYLAKDNDLYFLSRLDPQNAFFEQKKISKLYTLKCFLLSLITSVQFSNHPKWGYQVIRIPFMSHMVIHKLIGIENALKLARKFNKMQLSMIAKRIQPDFIFYADGFDLYPCLEKFRCFSDIQDDFDPGNFRDNDYNLRYSKLNISKSRLNFVVSRQASINLGALYNSKFIYTPNGVEIEPMRNVDPFAAAHLKSELGLNGKYVITYIGADAWYNINFLKEIASITFSRDSSIHFLIVGNLPSFSAPNVTFVGPVDKEKSYLFYWISDLGLLLKDSKGSNFLRNSIPLKIVQYGILCKQFISPPIVWLEEEHFKNIEILTEYTASNILESIIKIKCAKTNNHEPLWETYDWGQIIDDVKVHISSELQNEIS